MSLLTATLSAAAAVLVAAPAQANTAPQSLPYSQNWSTTGGLITTNNNWTNVPGVVGYRGDALPPAESTLGTNPQNVTAGGSGTPQSVIANQSNPSTLATGGVAEFDGIPNPTVALQPSNIADAPHVVFYLNTTGFANIDVSINLRDIDGSADDAVQQVALQYRIGSSGAFQNTSGYVGDATTGGSATQETALNARLGNDANSQSLVEVRVITTNATGNDEWVGIDDVTVSGALPLSAVRISEFRSRGQASVPASDPDGEVDEFVEITNRSAQSVDVSNVFLGYCDGAFGAAPFPFNGFPFASLAPGQSVVLAHPSYTGGIDGNKTPDGGISGFGPPGASGGGYVLYAGSGGAASTVIDQVGAPGTPCAEGAGITTPTAPGNYSFVRRAGFNTLPDTNDNAADFDFVSDTGGTFGSVSVLGLPGPENSLDPRRLFAASYQATLLAPGSSANASPNRAYTAGDSRNPPLGVLRIRRTLTNTSGLPIEDLRFRIYVINTKNSPSGTSRADLRAIDSEAETITVGGTPRNIAPTLVEGACPGAEPECHGLNSRVQVDLTALGDQLNPGASVDFSLDFAVERGGPYVVAFFPEARLGPPLIQPIRSPRGR